MTDVRSDQDHRNGVPLTEATEADSNFNEADLYRPPVFDDQIGNELGEPAKPEWPVSKVTLASAGPLAAGMKLFLDDMEPLIGLLADEIGVSKDRFQDARNLVMAYGFLRIVTVFADSAFSLNHSWDFNDGVAQRELRVAWLDGGHNAIYEHVGWGYNDDYVEGFRELDAHSRLGKLENIILSINEKYKFVPEWELFTSANAKLITFVCGLIRFDAARMLKHVDLVDPDPINNWQAFLEETQGLGSVGVEATVTADIAKLEKLCKKEDLISAQVFALKSFAFAFQPPYTNKDMLTWRHVAKETYEKLRASSVTKEIVSGFYHKPYETDYGTDLPDIDVFQEIFRDIERRGDMTFDNSEHANEFYSVLIHLEYIVSCREHYPSLRTKSDLEDRWNKYFSHVNEYYRAELEQEQSLQDDDYLDDIDKLVGLGAMKDKLRELGQLAKRPDLKSEIPPASHIIFAGNPGTGKTTVAELLGRVYLALGLLPKGHVVSVTRADLVADYVGQTAPKVTEAVEKAMGGVLFIDEAYTLRRSDSSQNDPYGQEAIDALLTHMENKRGKFIVVAAGYPAEMSRFTDSNPGLGSRFSDRWQFDDYSEPELWEIFSSLANANDLTLGQDVEATFLHIASEAKKKKDFSNARWVRSLIEESRVRRASRLSTGDKDTVLLSQDLSTPRTLTPMTSQAVASIEQKLSELVGLESVKEDVRDLIALQNLQIRRAERGLPPTDNDVSHLVFSGPPGTGKTTVARLIGQMYKDMGILRSGQVVETQRADLVAGFIGQTAIKTQEAINKSMGGVLFIDEAYTLLASKGNGGSQDFGQEAIDTLLKSMEDRKGEFVVIVAGYEDKMKEFLASNPGLASRFGKKVTFDRWPLQALQADIETRLAKQYLHINGAYADVFQSQLMELIAWDGFASGRTSRTFVEKLVEVQARRLSSSPDGDLTEIMGVDAEAALLRTIG